MYGIFFNLEYSQYVATITAKAFLWHQIRCIMGVLFLIGQNVETPEIIKELLDVNSNPKYVLFKFASAIIFIKWVFLGSQVTTWLMKFL